METIKVNMSPNPLDVQTIHASQNDTEARQWEFELHNNGELIDTSDVKEQLVFKAYKGGTEQLLPENGSTPTTSPFKGNIKYPQGLLTDQEFLYRKSPTEEDGYAKIETIYGNTLVWNQLVQNGNFVNTNGWNPTRGTITANNNICQFTATETGNLPQSNRINYTNITPLANHSYLMSAYIKAPRNTVGTIGFTQIDYWPSFNLQANVRTKVSTIYTFSNVSTNINLGIGAQANANDVVEISNVQMFDLTQMGLDISNPSDFTSLFSLPYYDFNQGSLLSFNGNGIKTVGKNLFHNTTESATNNGITWTVNEDGSVIANGTCTNNVSVFRMYTPMLAKGSYFINGTPSGSAWGGSNPTWRIRLGHQGGSYINDVYAEGRAFTLTQDEILEIQCNIAVGKTVSNQQWLPMICFADVTDTTFEPYTSSTLSLPISTYFPSGMKRAGNVYDELTESKAITRLKKVTYSSSTGWTTRTTGSGWNIFEITPSDIKHVGTPPNETIKNNRFNWNRGLTDSNTIRQVNQIISVRKDDITSLADWGTYLASNPLEVIYELATPTETPITTASLVTENAEIPLSNNDGVLIGKCTEELSAEPGFHDAKIKLSDADGECYSNKIQLHIERSPQ